MMSGEYFLSDKAKDELKNKKKRDEKIQRKQQKVDAKAKEFEAPEEDLPVAKEKKSKKESSDTKDKVVHKRPDIDDLKDKFLTKKKKKV